jgi:hypothetical protein
MSNQETACSSGARAFLSCNIQSTSRKGKPYERLSHSNKTQKLDRYVTRRCRHNSPRSECLKVAAGFQLPIGPLQPAVDWEMMRRRLLEGVDFFSFLRAHKA